MALLVPGIGEEYLDGIQRARGNTVAQDLDGVVAVDADILHAALFHQVQQLADPRTVHFHADEIRVRRCRGHFHQGLAHAKADLEYPGCLPPENLRIIQQTVPVLETKARPAVLKAALLGIGHATVAQDKTADGSPLSGVGGVVHGFRATVSSWRRPGSPNRR